MAFPYIDLRSTEAALARAARLPLQHPPTPAPAPSAQSSKRSPRRLTERQAEVLRYICEYFEATGSVPALRDIAGYFGFRSVHSAGDHVKLIARKGLPAVQRWRPLANVSHSPAIRWHAGSRAARADGGPVTTLAGLETFLVSNCLSLCVTYLGAIEAVIAVSRCATQRAQRLCRGGTPCP